MLHALIRVVQYSVVFYFKIDQKMLFFTLLTKENYTKRAPLFIYVPRYLTHVVCTVLQSFPRHFKAKRNDGCKHLALNSN